MARYIDADKLEDWVYAFHLADAYWAIPMLKNAPTEDVIPRVELDAMRGAANSNKMHYENVKSEVALDLLSELKKDIHNKAVFPGTQDVHPYISLKVLDGIIQNYINRYYEEEKKNDN